MNGLAVTGPATMVAEHAASPARPLAAAAPSDAAACLPPLLDALGWRGSARRRNAAVGSAEAMEVLDLRNALANLGFPTEARRVCADAPDAPAPCLFIADDGTPYVLLPDGHFHGAAREFRPGAPAGVKGWAYVPVDGTPAADNRPGWLRRTAARFAGIGGVLLLLTLFLNLLALAAPLFAMAVYDQVIATGDEVTLWYMAAGMAVALACDAALRVLRGALLAHLAGRVEMLLGVSVLSKFLSLPLGGIERAPAADHLARLREVETLRWFFTGPLALAVIELPFTVLFLCAVAVLAGWLALLPTALALVFVVAGQALFRRIRRAAAAVASVDHHALSVDILTNLRAIKATGTEALWLERFRDRSARAAMASMRLARLDALVQNAAQFANVAAGGATLVAGAAFAIAGDLSVGALIATMALVWRALAPVQMIFVALTRVDEIAGAARRVDLLMAQPGEADGPANIATGRDGRHGGRITFSGVFLRYPGGGAPALANLSVDIKPGEVVAVVGANGSGKSSLLRAIIGLYQPQAGAVLIDGLDVRQIDPADLRGSVAYVPQGFDPFPGTIEDYFRLAAPGADLDDIEDACARADILDALRRLPDGLATSLSEGGDGTLSAGLLKGIALARGWLADASVVLLDEPGIVGDAGAERRLLDHIEMLRGRSTVVLVTHRISHLAAADRVLLLNHGALAFNGHPRALLAKMTGEAQ